MNNKTIKYLGKRIVAFMLAFLLSVSSFAPYLNLSVVSYAAGGTGSEVPDFGWKGKVPLHAEAYCTQGSWGKKDEDIYERVHPSQMASTRGQQCVDVLFALTICLKAGKGDPNCKKVLDTMKSVTGVGQTITEDTLKYFIENKNGAQTKNGWIWTVMPRFEEVLKTAGYMAEGESLADVEDKYFIVYMCCECHGVHPSTGGALDLLKHQDLVNVFLKPVDETPGDNPPGPTPSDGGGASLEFTTYKHTEEWTTDYNLRATKYDHETGQKIAGAMLGLYEAFDDKDKIDQAVSGWDGDEEGMLHRIADDVNKNGLVNDRDWYSHSAGAFRPIGEVTTDDNGHVETTVNHIYHFEKTFCDGHPAPQFMEVPEEEEDEETGEITNEDEIQEAQEENMRVANSWLTTVATCQGHAEGDLKCLHYHWIQDGVDEGTISGIAGSGGDPGETPDAGPTSSADGETSYEKSTCKADCEATYDNFKNLKFSYTYKEVTAREGYTLHGIHTDDIPIEIITSNSSQGGANSTFAMNSASVQYSDQISIEDIGVDSGGGALMMAPLKAKKAPLLMSAAPKAEEGKENSNEEMVAMEGLSVTPEDNFASLEAVGGENTKKEISDVEKATPETAEYDSENKEDAEAKPEIKTEEPVTAESVKQETLNEDKTAEQKPEDNNSEDEGIDADEDKLSNTMLSLTKENTDEDVEVATPVNATYTDEDSTEEIETDEDGVIADGNVLDDVNSEGIEEAVEEALDDGLLAKFERFVGEVASAIGSFFDSVGEAVGDAAKEAVAPVRKLMGAPKKGLLGAGGGGEDLFPPKYYPTDEAGSPISDLGPKGNYSHCNGADDETSENPQTNPGTIDDNQWQIYDHRFEGEIHFNKRDLDLAEKNAADFDAYGNANGDGTLEGAVYGLFAESDIVHPDGKTGVVYKPGEIVAIATTDRDGNGSFMAITEAPGTVYKYEDGTVDRSGVRGTKNLYYGYSHDDYEHDASGGNYKRTYPDYLKENGNYWIGRPLIVGEYYIKELSRSEGYELSVDGKANLLTNLGHGGSAEPESGTDEGTVNIVNNLQTDISAETKKTSMAIVHGYPASNEMTLDVSSYKTGGNYDILFKYLPAGTKVYREDSHYEYVGEVDEVIPGADPIDVPVLDEHGNKIPVVAPAYTYPMYDALGNVRKEDVALELQHNSIMERDNVIFDSSKIAAALSKNTDMDGEYSVSEVSTILTEPESYLKVWYPSYDAGAFIKTKVESALNSLGMKTMKSTYNDLKYNTGDAAAEKPGWAVRKLTINNGYNSDTGDVIASIISFYSSHPYYNVGGINSFTKVGNDYVVELYVGSSNLAAALVNYGGSEAVLYYEAPRDASACTDETYRVAEIIYTESGSSFNGDAALGKYENLVNSSGRIYKALLKPKPIVSYSGGSYVVKAETENRIIYYPEGSTPHDKDGNIIYVCEKQFPTHKVPFYDYVYSYHLLGTKPDDEKEWVLRVPSTYTDDFGISHTDASSEQTVKYYISLPGDIADLTKTLTAEDIEKLPSKYGFTVGAKLGLAYYYLYLGAKAYVYTDYSKIQPGPGSYIVRVALENMDQNDVISCADTIKNPLTVFERPVRGQLNVKKDITLNADNDGDGKGDGYKNNTFDVDEIIKKTNFRFKAYLKSNLERIYRTDDGTIVWMDRNGNEFNAPAYYNDAGSATNQRATNVKWTYSSAYSGKTVDFPEDDISSSGTVVSANVQKFYTKVKHETDSLTTADRMNNLGDDLKTPQGGAKSNVGILEAVTTTIKALSEKGKAIFTNGALYSYDGKNSDHENSNRLNAEPNTGYTRVLEYTYKTVDDANSAGGTKQVLDYNYDKFFDAVSVANNDKWDDKNPTYTSYRPIGNILNRDIKEIGYQISNAMRSDKVRQFAITWYLNDEVEKLVKEVAASANTENEADKAAIKDNANKYAEQVYDHALYNAIIKAENYLKPFFRYDLDTIYQVKWDSEAEGGKDKDYSTLSADVLSDKSAFGLSAYLPYGDYVIREEVPRYVGDGYTYNDAVNKMFETDELKFRYIPSLYQNNDSGETNEDYDSRYIYDPNMDLKDMAKAPKTTEPAGYGGFYIRFGEEWGANDSDSLTYQSQWVIRANNYNGSFEVYKWGLDTDKAGGGQIQSAGGSYSYYGFKRTQEEFDPLKDYYENGHNGHKQFDGSGSGSSFKMNDYTAGITAAEAGNDSDKYNIESKASNNQETPNRSATYFPHDLTKRFFYGNISEDKGTIENVPFTDASKIEDVENPRGQYLATKTAMYGELTAVEGKYAPMLVPWTVIGGDYDAGEFAGYTDVSVHNRLYSAKLRLEKLDSETHEPILHDDAAFSIYKAAIDTSTGYVKFYEADTTITGSKEFIESYCEKKSTHPVDPENPRGLYEGTVKAGTPVCLEADQVILGDRFGNQVSEFKAFSTMRDIGAKAEMDNASTVPATYMFQNTGYLETPQALGAGAYVILEKKVPSGYVRTKPLAIEVYSDKVTYYKEGNKDERVIAAVYEYDNVSASDELSSGMGTSDEATEHGNKVQDTVEIAQVYVEDIPIKLTVEKVKESSAASADTTSDKSVSYKVSGRVEGSLSLIGGRDDLEYVYSENGKYLGYAYYKGTLEYLAQLKKLYDSDADPITNVDVVYTGTTFAGYGYVTRPLLTSDDDNKYVVNARLTMFDALQLRRNDSYEFGKSDYAFSFPDSTGNHGLIIERDINSNIKRMYVEEGYAGIKTQFLPEVNEDGTEVTAHYLTGYEKDGTPIYTDGTIYDAETVERFDTDILHYDLDSLSITWTETEDSVSTLYGYDRNKVRVDIKQLEHDKALYPKTDNEYSIYAFKGSLPVFEITGGDLTKVSYDSINKRIKVADGTVVYHLDTDGNRDSMVDPYTGMAYVIEDWEGPDGTVSEKWMVWAVEVYRDEYGNVISQDKITTSRIATVWENIDELKDTVELKTSTDPNGDGGGGSISTTVFPESGSTSGSWHKASSGMPGGESHHQTSDRTNKYGQNMNGQVLITDAETDALDDASKDFGNFYKEFDPVYDPYGNIYYYQRSDDTYDKGSNLYDRNGDFVRYDDTDDMEEYNRNAYRINDLSELYDMDGVTEDTEPSSSKLLYHRFGEGYVLQNTWLTSDKTPNDPFRFTQTDGQADILKRVPEGNYIIEEVYTPNGELDSDENGGYIKAFPVPVTVNEDTQMHHAKMVDHTTKIEIVKLDTPNGFRVDVIAADTGDKIGDYLDEKSSYSFGLVEGAQLTLYEAKKVYSSDYEKYPKGYYLVKKDGDSTLPYEFNSTEWKISSPKTEKMQWTTSSDRTIYVEGLPQGYYILEETVTPEGFLKAPLIGIQVDTSLDVKEVMVKEDHTKVEIEKVFFDENTPKALGGARFELHRAKVNGSGDVVYDADGNPEYEPTALLSWTTSDGKEWVNLEKAFADMFEQHGIDGTTFSYVDANGLSHTLTRTSVEYTHDASLQAGPLLKYPTDAREIFEDGSGRKVVCSAFQPKAKGLAVTYQYDFEYDFCEMPAVNDYAHSYTTVSGTRRFNYLPVEAKYVAVEVTAPAGFTLARPKLITVDNTENIQRYIIEDTKAQLIISKMIEGKNKEYEGAVLALYRAEGTSLVEDDAHLVEKWVSGTDGRYDDNDLLYGRIQPGYVKGDLRPHKIEGLAAGNYYLVEVESPYYYKLFDPVFIDYTDISEIKLVRQYNCPVEGKIIVHKQDEEAHPLDGAVYRIRAYKETDMITPVSDATYTAVGSDLVVEHLPVGEADSDGNITPYTYTVREVVPPKGYSAMNISYVFTFMPRKDGDKCYESGDVAVKELTFTDTPTKFKFEKKDFKSTPNDALYIEGATIGLFEMTGTDASGNPLYDPASPIRTIDTHTADGAYEIEGLEAGKSYVFVETNVPDGYNPMIQPLSFTVSQNGRSITVLENKLNVLSFETVDESDFELGTENIDIDSIKSAKMTGRYIVSLMNEVTDKNGVLKESWPGGMTHVINIGSGYTEDEEYTITEKLRYSDGTVQITDVETVNFHFDENGNIELNSRGIDKLSLAVYYGTGEKIDEISSVTSTDYEKVIENGIINSKPVITLTQAGGEAGDPLRPGVMSVGEIRIYNPNPSKQNADVEVTFDANTELMDAMGGEWDGTTLKYSVSEVPAFASKSVMFLVDASGEASTVTAKVKINGKTFNEEKKIPLVKPNKLTVYNELVGSGKDIYGGDTETFKIRLWSNESGSELAGEYAYSGSKSGTLKSGDEITLKANEYVLIDTGAYTNVHYTALRTANGRVFTSKNTQGDFTDAEGAFARFTRSVIDTSDRAVFRKGETYTVKEFTSFTDGIEITTNRLEFALGDNGGVSKITAFDLATKVAISKVAITGGEEIPDTKLTLYDLTTGEVVDSWTTTGVPHIIEGVLVSGRSYRLEEIKAADGWGYTSDVTFTVDTQGYVVQRVKMVDEPTIVKISKKDITGAEEIPGCKLQIIDKDGNIVEEWISGTMPHEIIGKLIADETYTLREIRPADGWAYAEDITFTVEHDGGVVTYAEMRDKPTHVEITKTDITGTEEMPGCVLQIIDKDGNIVEEWISGTTPHIIEGKLIADETYRLVEKKVADDKALTYAEDIHFTVSHDGSIDVVVMKDDVTDIDIVKKNTSGEMLPGVKLRLFRLLSGGSRELIEEWVTGDSAQNFKERLEVETKYIISEVETVSGYSKLAHDILFVLDKDGTFREAYYINSDNVRISGSTNMANGTRELTVYNAKAVTPPPDPSGSSPKVIFRKYEEQTNKALAGAEFTIYKEDKTTVVGKVVTDESGYAKFELPYNGMFYYLETKAPAGYEMLTTEFGEIDLRSRDTVTISVENKVKIGYITASFDRDLFGLGKFRLKYRGSVLDRIATGDNRPIAIVLIIAIVSALGLAGAFIYTKKRKGGKSDEENS